MDSLEMEFTEEYGGKQIQQAKQTRMKKKEEERRKYGERNQKGPVML